jgi:hypothetical protein
MTTTTGTTTTDTTMIMKRKSTMTDVQPSPREDRGQMERARPAGSASRAVQERAEREAGARRALFIASVAGLIATFGVVAASDSPLRAIDEDRPPPIGEAVSSRRVVAEVPILSVDGQRVETVVHFIAPEPGKTAPRLRTRAS